MIYGPADFSPSTESLTPIARDYGRTSEPVLMCGEKKKLLLLPVIQLRSSSIVAILSELTGLLLYNTNGFTNVHIFISAECQCPTIQILPRLCSIAKRYCRELCLLRCHQWSKEPSDIAIWVFGAFRKNCEKLLFITSSAPIGQYSTFELFSNICLH
jgi:hypothetical protein